MMRSIFAYSLYNSRIPGGSNGQLSPATDDTIWWLFCAHQDLALSAYADRYSMKEFMGRVMYPFLFSASSRLTFAGLFTHSSIFFTGIWCSSAVSMLRGAVNFGVTGLSPFAALGFLAFGVAFGRGLASFRRGELEAAPVRPLRVVLRSRSSSTVDLGVGGEKSGCSFYQRLARAPAAAHAEVHVPAVHHIVRCGSSHAQDRNHPASQSACWSTRILSVFSHIGLRGQASRPDGLPHVTHAKGSLRALSI